MYHGLCYVATCFNAVIWLATDVEVGALHSPKQRCSMQNVQLSSACNCQVGMETVQG